MEIDTMDMVFAIEIVCLVMFIWHRYVRPIKWIVEIDLGILRVILPVLVIGGMIWGIVDRIASLMTMALLGKKRTD